MLTNIKLALSRVLINDVHRTLSPFSEYSGICLSVVVVTIKDLVYTVHLSTRIYHKLIRNKDIGVELLTVHI